MYHFLCVCFWEAVPERPLLLQEYPNRTPTPIPAFAPMLRDVLLLSSVLAIAVDKGATAVDKGGDVESAAELVLEL